MVDPAKLAAEAEQIARQADATTSAGNPRGDRMLAVANVLATCALAHAVAQLQPSAEAAGDAA
jgi:hypothetical protein